MPGNSAISGGGIAKVGSPAFARKLFSDNPFDWSRYWAQHSDPYSLLWQSLATKPPIAIALAQQNFVNYIRGNNSDSRDTWAKLCCIGLQ